MSASPPDTAARARNGDLVVFAANGFSLASLMSRIPDVKEMLGLSPGQLAALLFATSLGALAGLPLAGRIAHRFGAQRTVQAGCAFVVPGLLIVATLASLHAPYLALTIGMFLFGFGNGVWDVSQNLEGTIIEQGLGRAIMPWFHAAFSGGTVAGALTGAAVVALRVPVLPHLGVAMVLTALAVLWGTVRFLPAFDEADDGSPTGSAPARSAWTEPRTLLIGLMVLAAAFTEGIANDWLAVAFVDGYKVPSSLGVVALAVFLTFMTAGRILGTSLLDRHGRVPVLRVLFLSALVGCALTVFGGPVLGFVGVAIWGVGASLGFPVGMSAAADEPARAHARLSVVSTIGYAAFLGGPPLLGFLGDHFGVLRSLLVVGVVSLLALFLVPVARPPHDTEPAGGSSEAA